MPTAYILKDGNGRIYIGSTTDISRRLREHQRGHTATTKKLKGATVVWQKEFPNLSIARACERKIKNWKSRKMVNLLAQGVFDI